MPCQLPADCLNEIFEYLEKDKVTLHSCLLVNRLWCEVSVRILWRNIWIVNPVDYGHRLKVGLSILSTLIACLPNKSKIHLYEKGILNSNDISKTTPLFDYASFCKVLSIHGIGRIIVDVFKNHKYLAKEIIKMFMTKFSLKKLSYYTNSNTVNLSFIRYPGAKDCLRNLSKFSCNSNVKPAFFYKLSQICHNIQSLTIEFKSVVSNGLKDLISSQNSLKYLSLSQTYGVADWTDIIPSLSKHSTKFCPNLKSLYTLFKFDKIETLKIILNDCQQLESIETQYIYDFLSEKELLETLAKYSPKNFYRLKLINYSDSKLVPKDLEEFFSNWKNRVPLKSFSFIIRRWNNSLESKEGNMKVIEKYKKLGIIKKFETILY
ncbi:hypothetical protein GLOIN_2v1784405 [Rhizophagus irregularis DAOM 181602=DAOM 197198]|nr:hypothetical protein GLOIN_2v1784405 [Rhizophagus irregularis DAOM 181602=DAOM 197198]